MKTHLHNFSPDVLLSIQTEDWKYLLGIASEQEKQIFIDIKERFLVIREKNLTAPSELSKDDIEFALRYFPKREAIKIKTYYVENNYKKVFLSLIKNVKNLELSVDSIFDLYLDYWHSGVYDSDWHSFLDDVYLAIKKICWQRALTSNSDKELVLCWTQENMDVMSDEEQERVRSAVDRLGITITYKLLEKSDENNLSKPQSELAELYVLLQKSDLLASRFMSKIVRNVLNET